MADHDGHRFCWQDVARTRPKRGIEEALTRSDGWEKTNSTASARPAEIWVGAPVVQSTALQPIARSIPLSYSQPVAQLDHVRDFASSLSDNHPASRDFSGAGTSPAGSRTSPADASSAMQPTGDAVADVSHAMQPDVVVDEPASPASPASLLCLCMYLLRPSRPPSNTALSDTAASRA